MGKYEKGDGDVTVASKPPIVSAPEWEAALGEMLVKEKELTRARDALAAARRRMPWLAVDKQYEFDGPEGKASLLDLFAGRRQLIVYRAFFEPGVHGWPDHACPGLALMLADQVGHVAHLNARDTTLVFASRGPQADVERVKKRMGLGNAVVHHPPQIGQCAFYVDFGVDDHGTNAFIRDGGRVYRTYFINNRGDEAMGSVWSYLDMTALGRQETGRTLPWVTPRAPLMNGGTGTTSTAPASRRGGSESPIPTTPMTSVPRGRNPTAGPE